jgi:hypothetical protein
MHDERPALGFVDRVRERFDWFRDEVALDFPSLAAAADRMRESFLAVERSSAVCRAEVHVTPDEAVTGPRVPVHVVVRSACPTCGGRGRTWDGPCPPCAGTGDGLERQQVHLRLPSGVRDGARLLFNVVPPRGAATIVDLRVSVCLP